MKQPELELCASSVKAIELAKKHRFDRIELCQNLEQGGITPSTGLIQFALDTIVECHILIRPRVGNFIYSPEEIQIILNDIKHLHSFGIKGVVVGALTDTLEIDLNTLEKIVHSANQLDLTFHRAFDDIKDWKKAMDQLISFGFKRILTSGGEANVNEGFETLKEMKAYASGRIEIMTGGGINTSNIQRIATEIKPDAIHFSGTSKLNQHKSSLFAGNFLEADEEKISTMLQALKQN